MVNRKVFRHDGTTAGQGSVSTGATELTELTRLVVPLAAGEPELPDPVAEVAAPVGELAAPVGELGAPVAELGGALLTTVVRVSVTGQMVVETATVMTVVTTELAGQSGTVGPHEVMVWVVVVKMVDVLS
jgi:hypothetical protein